MKIIGQSKSGWICDLNEDEIAALQGLDNTYRKEFIKPKVGMSLDISKNWNQYWKVSLLLEHKKTLKQFIEKMNDSIDNLNIDTLKFDENE